MRTVRFPFVLALLVAAFPMLSQPASAATTLTTSNTYKVEATRELLIGGETRSGYIIKSDSDFVSLSNCTNRTCPDKAAGVRDDAEGLRTECGTKCWVRVTNPLNGRCAVAPLEDVGPEFKNDDWWLPATQRNINLRPEYTGPDIPRGLPAAKYGFDGNDVGYGVSGGTGLDFRGEPISTGSGIDLGERTWSDLGLPLPKANDYAWDDANGVPLQMSVTMLWQSNETVAVADRACLGTQTINPLPSTGLIAGDIIEVTSQTGVNVRPTASTSGTSKGVLALGQKAVYSGKSQTVNSQIWWEVRTRYGDGWMLSSSGLKEGTRDGIVNRARNSGADSNLTGIVGNTTGTTLSRITVGGNSRVKAALSGVYTNQGPRYESAKGLNIVVGGADRAFVGVGEMYCQSSLSIAQVTMLAVYTDSTTSGYVTMPAMTCGMTGWQRVVTPAIKLNGAKTVDYVNFYALTGGKVSAGTIVTDNFAILQFG